MANYSDIFPISSGGSGGGGENTISENTDLQSGGFFIGTNTQKIQINISGLGESENFAFQNTGTEIAVISGLAQLNSVAIPVNKGVSIAPGGFIWIKKNSFNTAISLAGSYTIDWIPGFEPSYLGFDYTTPGATSGIIYYLGATKYNQSFVNPHTRGDVIVSASSNYDANRLAWKTLSRSNTFPNYWHGISANGGWLRLQFVGYTVAIQGFELWSADIYGLNTYFGANAVLEASNNNVTWTNIKTFSPLVTENQRFYSGLIENTQFYQYYRFRSVIAQYHIIGDIELWGWLLPT